MTFSEHHILLAIINLLLYDLCFLSLVYVPLYKFLHDPLCVVIGLYLLHSP